MVSSICFSNGDLQIVLSILESFKSWCFKGQIIYTTLFDLVLRHFLDIFVKNRIFVCYHSIYSNNLWFIRYGFVRKSTSVSCIRQD